MKKIISILLVAALALTLCFACAVADETRTTIAGTDKSQDINKASADTDVTRSAQEYTSYEADYVTTDAFDPDLFEGCWVSFEGGYDLYIPGDWYIYDLNDEQIEDGFTSMYGDDVHYLVSKIIPAEMLDEMEVSDYDSLIAVLEEMYTDIHVYVINDMPYPIVCCWDDTDFMTLFSNGTGELHNVILVNADDDDFRPFINSIICTLSLTVE